MKHNGVLLAVLFFCSFAFSANNAEALETEDFLGMSVEELMDISIVTSVEGTASSWFNTPSAIYVITAEDIRRSGHRSIAEALRMVPGMQVLQNGSSQWQITSRGFSTLFANKLLVMIDGRTVYDPFFSGTFWDIQDVLLEDIDRIEVIRGPGATLWGANAVNGVINISTKKAEDTQGTYLTGGMGNYERGFGAIRHGGKLSEESYYRVWTKYFNRDAFKDIASDSAHDEWDMAHGGFRVDTTLSETQHFTLQGDGYNSDEIGEATPVPIPTAHLSYDNVIDSARVTGGDVLFRLEEETDTDTGWSLQGYYEHQYRKTSAELQTKRDTVDLDFRHHFMLGDHHKIIWGMGWRRHQTKVYNNSIFSFSPARKTTNLYSSFIQDTIELVPNKWYFMLGSKFEDNTFTGFEWQPSGRIWYTPDDRQTFWAAVSRPVRTPALFEHDSTQTVAVVDLNLLGYPVPSGTYSPLTVSGNQQIKSEKFMSYEVGYRLKATEYVTSDTAFFYNDMHDLINYNSSTFGSYNNVATGKSYGIEELLIWQVRDNWRLETSYSYMYMDVDPDNVVNNGNHIPHMLHCRSYFDITENLELNTAVYWQESRENVDAHTENEGSLRLDAGLTWRPNENLEIAIVGQNLLDSKSFEANDDSFQAFRGEIPRAYYAQLTYRF